jgi:histidinol-phosphate aminotransferase
MHGQDARATNAHEWQQQLRNWKILVRWFDLPEVKNYLRITIGTQAEAAALVKATKGIMTPSSSSP